MAKGISSTMTAGGSILIINVTFTHFTGGDPFVTVIPELSIAQPGKWGLSAKSHPNFKSI